MNSSDEDDWEEQVRELDLSSGNKDTCVLEVFSILFVLLLTILYIFLCNVFAITVQNLEDKH